MEKTEKTEKAEKAEKKEKMEALCGKKPHSSELLYFKEEVVPGDGNCGFYVINESRAEVTKTLLTLSDNPHARQQLCTEIRTAFQSGELTPLNRFEWEKLYNLYIAKTEECSLQASKIAREINSSLETKNFADTDAYIELIEQIGSSEQQKRIMTYVFGASTAQEALNQYCQSQSVFEYYVRSYDDNNHKLWLGFQSALLYAEAKHITLYVWQYENKHSPKLTILGHSISKEPQARVIHMLMTHGFIHYNRLIEIESPATSLVPIRYIAPKIIWKKPKTLNNLNRNIQNAENNKVDQAFKKNEKSESNKSGEKLLLSPVISLSQETQKTFDLLQQALRIQYQQNDRIRLPSSRKQHISLSIQDCYVELALVHQRDDIGEQFLFEVGLKQQRLPSESLMSAFSSGETAPDKVLIFGAPGTGKSTLCQRLGYLWANGNAENPGLWANRYPLVFQLRLKSIETFWEKIKVSDYPLATWLYESWITGADRSDELTVKKLQALLYHKNLSCLLILDGLDEVAALLDSQRPESMVLQEALKYRHVLMTTRPGYLALGFVEQYRITRQVLNLGFSEHKISQYIANHFTYKPSLGEQLEEHLIQYPALSQIARMPLVLYLLCEEWAELKKSDKANTAYLSTLTQLYQRFYQGFQEGFKLREVKGPMSFKTALLCLEKLAYDTLTSDPHQPRHIMARQELMDVIVQLTKNYTTLLTSSASLQQTDEQAYLQQLYATGLIHPTVSEKSAHQTHEYSHKSLQEFMAAQHIINVLLDRKHDDYSAEEYQQVVLFLIKHKYNASFQLMVWFVAGLSALPKYSEGHESVWAILTVHQVDLIGLRHQLLLIHALEQMQFKPAQKQQALSTLTHYQNQIEIDLKLWLDYSLRAESTGIITSLSAGLSACPTLADWWASHLHEHWENYSTLEQQKALSHYMVPLVNVSSAAIQRLLQQCQQLGDTKTTEQITQQLEWLAQVPWRLLQRSPNRIDVRDQLLVLLKQSTHLELQCTLLRGLSWLVEEKELNTIKLDLEELQKAQPKECHAILEAHIHCITIRAAQRNRLMANNTDMPHLVWEPLAESLYHYLQARLDATYENILTEEDVKKDSFKAKLTPETLIRLTVLLCTELPHLPDTLTQLFIEQAQINLNPANPQTPLSAQWRLLLEVLQHFEAAPYGLAEQLTERESKNKISVSSNSETEITAGWQEKLMLSLTEDPNPGVRKQAWQSLMQLGSGLSTATRKIREEKLRLLKENLLQEIKKGNSANEKNIAEAIGACLTYGGLTEDFEQMLVNLLQDNDQNIRENVINAFQQLKLALSPQIELALIFLIQNKDRNICKSVINVLEGLNKFLNSKAEAALVNLLQAKKSYVRSNAVWSVVQLKQLCSSELQQVAETALVNLLQHKNSAARRCAVEVFGQIKQLSKSKWQQQAEAALVKLLQDEYVSVRRSAVEAFGQIKQLSKSEWQQQAEATLINLLRDEYLDVRKSVVEVLGQLKKLLNVEAEAALLKLLHNENWSIRLNAMAALGELKQLSTTKLQKQAEASLVNLLQDEVNYVRKSVVEVLGQFKQLSNPEAEMVLVNLLQNTNSDVRKSAVAALGQLKQLLNPEAEMVLVNLLQDTNSDVRKIAVAALLELKQLSTIKLQQQAEVTLIHLLRDRNSYVLQSAVWALGWLKQLSNHKLQQQAETALVNCLRHKLIDVRNTASKVLKDIAPNFHKNTFDLLQQLSEVSKYEYAINAKEILEVIEVKKSFISTVSNVDISLSNLDKTTEVLETPVAKKTLINTVNSVDISLSKFDKAVFNMNFLSKKDNIEWQNLSSGYLVPYLQNQNKQTSIAIEKLKQKLYQSNSHSILSLDTNLIQLLQQALSSNKVSNVLLHNILAALPNQSFFVDTSVLTWLSDGLKHSETVTRQIALQKIPFLVQPACTREGIHLFLMDCHFNNILYIANPQFEQLVEYHQKEPTTCLKFIVEIFLQKYFFTNIIKELLIHLEVKPLQLMKSYQFLLNELNEKNLVSGLNIFAYTPLFWQPLLYICEASQYSLMVDEKGIYSEGLQQSCSLDMKSFQSEVRIYFLQLFIEACAQWGKNQSLPYHQTATLAFGAKPVFRHAKSAFLMPLAVDQNNFSFYYYVGRCQQQILPAIEINCRLDFSKVETKSYSLSLRKRNTKKVSENIKPLPESMEISHLPAQRAYKLKFKHLSKREANLESMQKRQIIPHQWTIPVEAHQLEAALKNCPHPYYLDLSENHLNNMHVEYLVEEYLPQQPQLCVLRLSQNSITYEGFESLLKFIKKNANSYRLSCLLIDNNHIFFSAHTAEKLLSPLLDNTLLNYCDISLNYLPKGELKKEIGRTGKDINVVYEKCKRDNHWKNLFRPYNHITTWLNNRSSFFCSQRSGRGGSSLLTQNAELILNENLAVVSIYANKANSLLKQLSVEHAYLGIEYFTNHGQRRIIFAELFVDLYDKIHIAVTQVDAETFLKRTHDLEQVYQKNIQLTTKEQRKKLLQFFFDKRNQQDPLKYKKLPSSSAIGIYNCVKFVINALKACDIEINDEESMIPSVFVSNQSFCCIN